MSTARRKTKSNRTQPRLPNSMEIYRNIVETAQEGIWIGDPGGITIFVNQKMADMLGYTPEEMIGKRGLEFGEVGRRDWLQPSDSSGAGTSIQREYKFHRKDGGIIWTLVNASPLFDENNKYIGNLWMQTDITERKAAEEALANAKNELETRVRERTAELKLTYDELKLSQQQLQGLFQYMAEGVILLDMAGRVIRINPAASQILRITSDQLEKKHNDICRWKGEVVLADGTVLDRETLARRISMTRLDVVNEEAALRFPDGYTRRLRGSITALGSNTDNISGIIITFIDITNEKLLQEQLTMRLLKAQEEERKRIARELHDDTAPALSLISLEIDSLMSHTGMSWEEAVPRLGNLKSTTDRTMQDIRRYSHELHPAVLDHLGLIAALEQLVEETGQRAKLKIKLDVRGEERKLGEDVELVLFRISQEALNNIWKHAQSTGGAVTIDYLSDSVKLRISDNGKGFRVAEERAAAIKRGSLGLLSMKERANIIGADLKIESKVNRGTRVTIEVKNSRELITDNRERKSQIKSSK